MCQAVFQTLNIYHIMRTSKQPCIVPLLSQRGKTKHIEVENFALKIQSTQALGVFYFVLDYTH